MIRHFGQRSSWSLLALSAMLLSGAIGCHHRQAQPLLLPAQTAVPIETTPTPMSATLAPPPKAKLPPVPVVRDEPNPKKTKKQRTRSSASSGAAAGTMAQAPGSAAAGPAVQAPPPPEQPTDAAAKPATPTTPAGQQDSIGVFTVGGDQSTRNKQEAAGLIAANERRLSAMGGERGHLDPSLLSKVRNFQREAQQALGTGDVEGAKTLATKGKLLLDDLDRDVPSQ